MRVDRPGRQEEVGGHLLVRQTLSDQSRHLKLLRRELRERRGVTLVGRLARRAELRTGAICPRRGATRVEAVDRCAQLPPCVRAPALPPQMLSEQQVGPGGIEWPGVRTQANCPLEFLRRFV